MPRQPRFLRPGIYDITIKTLDDEYRLVPSPELNDAIRGVFGRALSLFPLLLHAPVVMSNHMDLLVSIPDGETLSRFMNHVNSNIARELGYLRGKQRRLWAKRYTAIEVVDDEAAEARLGYIMAHGAKEGLVEDPEQWPGVHGLDALLHGETLTGTWHDRTAEYRAGRLKGNSDPEQFKTVYDVPITPLPSMADLSPEEFRRRCRELMQQCLERVRRKSGTDGRPPLGAEEVCRKDPHDSPRRPKRSPRPLCHASTREAWARYKAEHAAFLDAYRHAAERFHAGDRDAIFPVCSFPPAGHHVLPQALPP